MNLRNPSEMVLKAFLNRLSPKKKSDLERFLPEGERLRIEELPELAEEVTSEGFSHKEMLERVHWSWFLPTLKTYNEEEQKLFIASLGHHASKNLAHTLEISSDMEEISVSGRNYLRKVLESSLLGPKDRLLPVDYLPKSPLNSLLNFPKNKLSHLINMLSMHDLAAELRQIVETKILKKLYSLLTDEEREFLKTALKHKEPFIISRIGLDRWDGDEEALRLQLHKRGLSRLGAALSGQDPDLIWYICHQLDIGRGNALFKLCAKEPVHGVTDAVIRQIEELIHL